MNQKILVTGGDGLVGNALRILDDPEHIFVTRADADLTDFEATLSLFERVSPTHVIHLAALVGGIGGNIMSSGDFFRRNILINANVLESARLVGVERLVSFMSTCVFPDRASYPLTVEQLHEGEPHPSNFGYAYAKRMLEVQSRAYRAQWNLDYVVGIPTNVYGPFDNWSLTEGHVVPALIHKAYLAKNNGEPLLIWGSGRPKREFVFSQDIARLADWMVRSYSGTEPLILTSGLETSIAELAELVVDAIGFKGEVVFDTTKPEGQFRKPSDSSKLHSLLPNFEFTPVHTGLQETVEWFVSNYPNLRR